MAAPVLVPDNTLITATPEDGRRLAMTMARRVMQATQPEDAKRAALRDVYVSDAGMLIALGQVVATEFATVAAANDYWRR